MSRMPRLKATRVAAWFFLLVIVALSVVPPTLRPTTTVPHDLEHALAFLGSGILFGIAYTGHEFVLSTGAVALCAVIEMVQLFVPGRHARMIDLVVDAAAALVGVFVGTLARRMMTRNV